MSWIYNGSELTEAPKDAVGYIYRIDINNAFYIGLKRFYTHRKVNKGKKELALQDGRASKKKLVTKESNWKNYCSSSETVKQLVEEGYPPLRTILRICYSLKELSYYENKYLYANIEEPDNLNENLSGKYFRKEIEEWIR